MCIYIYIYIYIPEHQRRGTSSTPAQRICKGLRKPDAATLENTDSLHEPHERVLGRSFCCLFWIRFVFGGLRARLLN